MPDSEPDSVSDGRDCHDYPERNPLAVDPSPPDWQAVSWQTIPWQEVPWTEWFARWLHQSQPTLSPVNAYELTLRLTTDTEIQHLNAFYRGKNQPTDVLAFAAIDSSEQLPDEIHATQPYYLGDVVISLETASYQAREAGHSLTCELAWLASHGLLHLLGWDHPDQVSLTRMLDKQEMLLRQLDGTPNHK